MMNPVVLDTTTGSSTTCCCNWKYRTTDTAITVDAGGVDDVRTV